MNPVFDQLLSVVTKVFQSYRDVVAMAEQWVVNRDLLGRVRLIVAEAERERLSATARFGELTCALAEQLGPHGYPADAIVLYEEDLDAVVAAAPAFPLEGFTTIRVVDRFANESDWSHVAERSMGGPPRVVFYSIKGGVGRSTAVAVVAAVLAERGHRVMVVDLDLASPGLSSNLLPAERRPTFGVVDWLVEDLVDHGDVILNAMTGTTGLPYDGEIVVVPAHGAVPGEYLAKLGRVWMPKLGMGGREGWARRLDRMIGALVDRWRPNVVLVDSRSGIDDIASACVTELGAALVLMFATDSPQTWAGYRVLFDHWRRTLAATDVRERLQCVGAAVPTEDEANHALALREQSWNLFVEALYDEVPSDAPADDRFSFDLNDQNGPHFPWLVRWDRAFFGVASWYEAFGRVDGVVMNAAFGPLLGGIVERMTNAASSLEGGRES